MHSYEPGKQYVSILGLLCGTALSGTLCLAACADSADKNATTASPLEVVGGPAPRVPSVTQTAQGTVTASLDGDNNEWLSGVICDLPSLSASFSQVEVLRGGTISDGGTSVGTFATSPVTNSLCGNTAAHSFKIAVSASLRGQYPGQRLYLYGLYPTNGQLIPLPSDGGTHIYAPKVFQVPASSTDATTAITAAVTQANDYVSDANPSTYAEVLLLAGTFKLGTGLGLNDFALDLTVRSGTQLGQQLQNLIIGGAGLATRLVFQNPSVGGFAVGSSQNVTLIGLLMDELYPPFTQGTITYVNANNTDIDIAIDPGMPLLSNPEYQPDGGGTYGMIYSSPLVPTNTFCTIPTETQYPTTNSWRLNIVTSDYCNLGSSFNGIPKVGDTYIQLARNGIGWMMFFFEDENIVVDGVTIYASPDLTTVFANNSGSILLNDVNLEPSPNPQNAILGATMPGSSYRLISTDGDGVNMEQNWSTPTIQNSSFSATADNAMDIGSTGIPLVPATASVSSFTYQTNGPPQVQQGDSLQVVDITTGAIVGTSKVSAAPACLGAGSACTSSATCCSGSCSSTLLVCGTGPGNTYKVTLAGAVTGLDLKDNFTIFDVSAASPNAVIRNNVFTAVAGDGVFCKSPGAVISGNTFNDIAAAGVGLTPQLTQGGTGGPAPTNVTVEGNAFSGGASPNWLDGPVNGQISMWSVNSVWGLSEYLATSNIQISSNTFSNYTPTFPPVVIDAATKIVFSGNSVITPTGTSVGLIPGATLDISLSSNIELNGTLVSAGLAFPTCTVSGGVVTCEPTDAGGGS